MACIAKNQRENLKLIEKKIRIFSPPSPTKYYFFLKK